jgi:hypothetical protein
MEYAFLVRTCELSPVSANSEAKRETLIAEKLSELCGLLESSLESLDDGGWRVLSHDVTQDNDSLIVTFLLCRPRGNPNG